MDKRQTSTLREALKRVGVVVAGAVLCVLLANAYGMSTEVGLNRTKARKKSECLERAVAFGHKAKFVTGRCYVPDGKGGWKLENIKAYGASK